MTVLAVLLVGNSVVPVAVRAVGDDWVMCEAQASVSLYTDSTRTTLVDKFSVADAPTQHKLGTSYFIIKDEQAGPGVDVVGTVTGTPYVFWFQSDSEGGTHGNSSTGNTWMRWRVQAADGGFVADSRYRQVKVAVDGERIVYKSFGPSQRGLFLSGGIKIVCPAF